MTESDHRRAWMGLLARAKAAQLERLWPDAHPPFDWLRRPEQGSMMVQGCAGAIGAAFNLGEVTVTRASVRLACGTVGHALVQGLDARKAERAALLDALLQTQAHNDLAARVLTPLRTAEAEAREVRAKRAAATKVDFFTMVRGEA